MKNILKYLIFLELGLIFIITLIQYNNLNKKEVKQATTILKEESNKKNEMPVIIETLEYSPMSSSKEKSIMGDIIDEAFKIMNREYKIIYCQWAVCLYKLDQCKVWGLMPSIYTEERAKKYLYSDPIVNSKFKLFYNKEFTKKEDIKFNTITDLSNYKIGIISGYFFEKKFLENLPLLRWFNSDETVLQGLINGTIQIAPIEEIVGWYLINKYYPNDVEKFGVIDKALSTEIEEGQYIMICKSYPNAEKILEEFNDAIKILKDTGIIQEIIEKYGAEEFLEVSK